MQRVSPGDRRLPPRAPGADLHRLIRRSSFGIGLLGLGRHGRRYADHLAAGHVPGATLTAIWRRDTAAGARAARLYRVDFEPSAELLCRRSDVDVVVVVIPPGLYPPVVETAAAAGKAMLLEKPLAADVASAERILATVRRAGVAAMVAHTLRFDPRVAALRREVARLGVIRAAFGEHRLEPRGLDWETDPEHGPGGILHQVGPHILDLLRFVTGLEVERLSCCLGRACNPRLPDVASVQCEMRGGSLAQIAASKVSGARSLAFEVVCDRGIARADLVAGRVEVGSGGSATRRARRRERLIPAVPTVPRTLGAFLGALRRGNPPPISLEDAARTHALVETALASARSDSAPLAPIPIHASRP